MKRNLTARLSIAALGLQCVPLFAATKPNIEVILADDIGCGDFGCHGFSKINTPNIDSQAAGGMRFTPGHALFAARTRTQ